MRLAGQLSIQQLVGARWRSRSRRDRSGPELCRPWIFLDGWHTGECRTRIRRARPRRWRTRRNREPVRCGTLLPRTRSDRPTDRRPRVHRGDRRRRRRRPASLASRCAGADGLLPHPSVADPGQQPGCQGRRRRECSGRKRAHGAATSRAGPRPRQRGNDGAPDGSQHSA